MGGEDKDSLVKTLIHEGNYNFACVYPVWNSFKLLVLEVGISFWLLFNISVTGRRDSPESVVTFLWLIFLL